MKMHNCARPDCPNQCPAKNKFCSTDCLAIGKIAVSRKEVEQVKLEDRLVQSVQAYLAKHPAKTARLSPSKVKKTHATPHEMVLLLSDFHYPEVVDPEVAMGLSYNGDVCVRRLERTRDVVLRYKQLRESSYPIKKLTVAMLGDMISGDIHDELAITNEMPTPVALVKLAYYLHDMFTAFAKEFEDVEVVCIPGNHPRTTQKPRYKQKTTTNFEYILGHFLGALALSGGGYRVQAPKDMVYVHRVFDWRLGLTHGDGVKSNSWGGVPFYGIRQRRDAVQALLRHLGQPGLDYLAMGHFHQPTVLEGTDCTVIMNGAGKGGDEYSIGTRLASQDPVQFLLTFHEKHGLTDYSRINLRGIV